MAVSRLKSQTGLLDQAEQNLKFASAEGFASMARQFAARVKRLRGDVEETAKVVEECAAAIRKYSQPSPQMDIEEVAAEPQKETAAAPPAPVSPSRRR